MSSNLSSRHTDDNGAPCDDTRGGYSCPNTIVASFDADRDRSLYLTVNDDEADYFVKRLAEFVGARSSRLSIAVQVAVHRLLAQATPKAMVDAADNLSILRRVEAQSSNLRHKRACIGVIGINGNPRTTRRSSGLFRWVTFSCSTAGQVPCSPSTNQITMGCFYHVVEVRN